MKLLFISLGCDKNRVDSEQMLALLTVSGIELTDEEDEADIIVINTCCFIGDAKEESINTILEMAEYRTHGSCRALIVTGCLAQRYQDEIHQEISEVDAILGTNSIDSICEAIEYVLKAQAEASIQVCGMRHNPKDIPLAGTASVPGADMQEAGDCLLDANMQEVENSLQNEEAQEVGISLPDVDIQAVGDDRSVYYKKIAPLMGLPRASKQLLTTPGHYAYLKIAEGCDKNCTYCVIPSVRGHYRSVPMEELLDRAKRLVDGGVKELVLVAQETTLYGVDLYGEKSLYRLLDALNQIPGLLWIRILYCYPEEVDEKLLDAMIRNEKVCHYLDIPIQHCNDTLLRRMGRRTNKQELTERIALIRDKIPDIALRTTLICGFPGETEAMHQELMQFVNDMEFDRLGAFAYSCEEGTPAASFPDQVPEEQKAAWVDEVMELQEEVSRDCNSEQVGRVLTVLIEGRVTDDTIYEEDSCRSVEADEDEQYEAGVSKDGGTADMSEMREDVVGDSDTNGAAYVGRSYRDAPDVDGYVFVSSDVELMTGDVCRVCVKSSSDYDLIGDMSEEPD